MVSLEESGAGLGYPIGRYALTDTGRAVLMNIDPTADPLLCRRGVRRGWVRGTGLGRIWWPGAEENPVVGGVRGSGPPGGQKLPGVCLGYLQQLGDLRHGATGKAHLPHRDGLLLTDLVDVVLRGRVDLLNLLF
jgi:hypothetical protein